MNDNEYQNEYQKLGRRLRPPRDIAEPFIRVKVRKFFDADEAKAYRAEIWLDGRFDWSADDALLADIAAPTAEECDERVERALELIGQGAATRLPVPADWAGTEEHFIIHLAASPAVSVEKENMI